MLSKDMAKIDWENQTAQEIKNLVRGLNPIMGAYTFLNGSKIKFLQIKYINITFILQVIIQIYYLRLFYFHVSNLMYSFF